MCGIIGISVSEKALESAANAEFMVNSLRHRGPDSQTCTSFRKIILGHTRLAIRELSGAADQPIQRADAALVYNGEIYNDDTLRRSLDLQTTSTGDTETVLQVLRKHGADGVAKLDGMFALAFLPDINGHTLILARDRFGQKPLYYGIVNDCFVFASEMRAILALPNFQPKLSAQGVSAFLQCEYTPDPLTCIEGIQELAPGHCLHVNLDTMSTRLEPYWLPGQVVADGESAKPVDTFGAAVSKTEELLTATVRSHLVSDVPVGVLLSGGIDSALIAALAGQESSEITCFTMGFEDSRFDETEHAVAVAKHLGMRHHIETVSSDNVQSAIAGVLDHLDQPFADVSIFPTSLLSKLVGTEVKVALGGDGGDEVFAGYEPFSVWNKGRWMHRLLGQTGLSGLAQKLVAGGVPREGYMPLRYKLQVALRGAKYPDALRLHAFTAGWMPDQLRSVTRGELRQAVDNQYWLKTLETEWQRDPDMSQLQRLGRQFRRTFMPGAILRKTDSASMMHSLELRAPLLDPQLVAFAETLPDKWLRGKRVLKELAKPLLPKGIIERKKQGFSVPVYSWLKDGPLSDLLAEIPESSF
ncbi:MAG: asparagine synthase (glutamine-hydrolyzing), partial [Planctomycetota bacterium]